MKTIHQPPVSRAAMNLAYLVTQNARDLLGALPLGDRIRLALRWRRHYRKIVGPVLAIK